ncbi:MAG: phytanoyl-CoA dioxygenase family protein [Pseudomonadota bacterium]
MATLRPDEIEAYQRDGIVIPDFRLPGARIDGLVAELDRVIAAHPGVRPEKLISIHVENGAEGIDGSRAFLDLARDRDVLDLVEAVIGPDIILWGCHMFCKAAGDGLEVPWHQDGHYWPIRPLATCTVWIALERSDAGNGCLRVVPGSHTGRALHPHLKEEGDLALSDRIEAAAFDEDEARDVVLEPGQMSLHDVYMIHGSAANRSTRRRSGLAIRYMPATSLLDRQILEPGDGSGVMVDFSRRPIWLVRGQDRTGRNDFTVGHA